VDTKLRWALDEASFVGAWSEGKAMSKERAIERAIDEAKARRDEGEHANPPAAGSTVMRIFALGHARVEQDGRPLDSPEWI